MGSTALMIRGESAEEMIKLVQLDRLMSLATAIADDAARSDVEMYAAVVMRGDTAWYDLSPKADDFTGLLDLDKARRALDYIEARGLDAFPWKVVGEKETGLIRFVEKVAEKAVANG